MNRATFETARGSLRCRDAKRARMSPNGTLLSLGRETVKARALLLWLVARSNLIDLGSLLKGEPKQVGVYCVGIQRRLHLTDVRCVLHSS